MYYKVHISETARNNPKLEVDENRRFNDIVEKFKTLDEVKEFITDHYGKIPKRKDGNTIYRDPNGKPVGFLHSFWNKDISHNSESWWQTDWIEVTSVTETPVLIN